MDMILSHALVIKRYEAMDSARRTFRREQQLKKLEEKKNSPDGEGGAAVEEEDDCDDVRVDEAKVEESKQMDFVKVQKRVRTTGGGSTGTVRNLRIRKDTTKYQLNLNVNSAHYDPKTRSIREDPLPEADPDEKFYGGDNQHRSSDQTSEFKQLNIHVWEAFEKGADIHMHAAPSQAEHLYKNFKVLKEKLISQTKCEMLEKYGNVAAEEKLPQELLLGGQCEREVEYDLAGRIVKGYESPLPESKHQEDVYFSNHSTVCCGGMIISGLTCCWQTARNSCCTGAAGVEASEAATNPMKANIARKRTTGANIARKRTTGAMKATWGADVPDNLVLDQGKLAEALKKEDERKRKYNLRWNEEVTPEVIDAFKRKRIHHDDPMKDLLS